MKKKKTEVSKEDFLKILTHCSQDDLNKIIKEKGKPPKLICPVIYSKHSKRVNT